MSREARGAAALVNKQGVSSAVRAEITAQLLQLKLQIDKDVQREISKLRGEILQTLRGELREGLHRVSQGISEIREKLSREDSEPRQLVVSEEQTRALTQAVSGNVLRRVGAMLDKTIVPRMHTIEETLHYHTQDTADILSSYGRAVIEEDDRVSRGLLTDGKVTSHILSRHVRTAFTDND